MKINDVNVNYVQYGSGKDIVLLHGWGQNIEMMKPIGDRLCKNFKITIIDLPGHGSSSEPTYPWDVVDYVEMLKELLDNLKIDNPIFIGHSFGGKVSLLYASKYKVHKMVLLASPFKKEIEKLSLKVKVLKFMKKVPVINKLEGFAKRHIGSTDYRNASDMMRQILVNTVNLDITEDVKKVKCPTLAIWGTNDEAVPVERAYELEKLMGDCGVITYEGLTHYAYLENLVEVLRVLRRFFEEDMED